MTEPTKTITEGIKEPQNITLLIKSAWDRYKRYDRVQQELSLLNINRSIHYIRNVVYRLQKREGLNNTRTNTTPQTTPQQDKPLIEVTYKEGVINVKTCLEWENYLKANKEISQTLNLFGKSKEEFTNFYKGELLNRREGFIIDDINHYGITRYRQKYFLNRAVLRIKGISEDGFNLDLNRYGLLTPQQIKTLITNFLKDFSMLYKTLIKKEENIIKGVLTQ